VSIPVNMGFVVYVIPYLGVKTVHNFNFFHAVHRNCTRSAPDFEIGFVKVGMMKERSLSHSGSGEHNTIVYLCKQIVFTNVDTRKEC
jgi:hypothetical protein